MRNNNIYEEQDAIRKLSTDELRSYAQSGGGMTGILSAMELSRRAQMNRAAAGAAVTQRVKSGGASVLADLARDASRLAPAPQLAPGYNSGGIVYANSGYYSSPSDWISYEQMLREEEARKKSVGPTTPVPLPNSPLFRGRGKPDHVSLPSFSSALDGYDFSDPIGAFKEWLDNSALGQIVRRREEDLARQLEDANSKASIEDQIILNSTSEPLSDMQRLRYFQYDPSSRQGYAEWASGSPLGSIRTEDPATGAREYSSIATRDVSTGNFTTPEGVPYTAPVFGEEYYANIPPAYGPVSSPAGPRMPEDIQVDEEIEDIDIPDPLAFDYEVGTTASAESAAPAEADVNRDRWARGVALLQAASRIANGNGNDLGNLAAGLAEGGASYADAMAKSKTEQYRDQMLAEQAKSRTSRESIAREQTRFQTAALEYKTRAEADAQKNLLEYYQKRDLAGGIEAANKSFVTYIDNIRENVAKAQASGALDYMLPEGLDGSKMTAEMYLQREIIMAKRLKDAQIAKLTELLGGAPR